jgi:hypothetical protein
MIVVGNLVAVYLLVRIFKGIEANYVKEGITIGLIWLAVNWLLDIAILIPMSGMSFNEYFTEIGLRYLVIPIMAVGFGMALEGRG